MARVESSSLAAVECDPFHAYVTWIRLAIAELQAAVANPSSTSSTSTTAAPAPTPVQTPTSSYSPSAAASLRVSPPHSPSPISFPPSPPSPPSPSSSSPYHSMSGAQCISALNMILQAQRWPPLTKHDWVDADKGVSAAYVRVMRVCMCVRVL